MAWRERATLGVLTLTRGLKLPVLTVTASDPLLTADDSGKTIFVDASSNTVDIILPSVAPGLNFRFYMKDSSNATTINAASTADYMLGGVNELETDDNEDGPNTIVSDAVDVFTWSTNAVAGDMVEFISDGQYWFYTGQGLTDGAASIA